MLMKISSEISVARKLMVMNLLTNYEGGLISESFSLWLKSPKKGANHYPDHKPPKGQIILKWFFGVFDFLQKTNENKSI